MTADVMRHLTDETAARVLLLHAAEPGWRPLHNEVTTHGAIEAARRCLFGVADVPNREVVARRLLAVDLPAVLDRLAATHTSIAVPGSTAWPTQLDDLGARAPLALLVRGVLALRVTASRSVAVIGARAATEYGLHMSTRLSADLAEAGQTVVSGAAYGIDAAAHLGALAVGGGTIAVIACGPDVVYPSAHDALYARLLDHGALVSETPPGRRPSRAGFLARNRVIAALTSGTVVVEAAQRSGALNTAATALELNRHVMAVPGPATEVMSSGCHGLIRRNEAVLVTSARDVLELVEPVSIDVGVDSSDSAVDQLTPLAAAVFEALPARRGVTVDVIAATTGLVSCDVLAALGQLMLAGLARQTADGWAVVSGAHGTPGRARR